MLHTPETALAAILDRVEHGNTSMPELRLLASIVRGGISEITPIEYAVRYTNRRDPEIVRYNCYGTGDNALDLSRDWSMGAPGRTMVRRRTAGEWEDIT